MMVEQVANGSVSSVVQDNDLNAGPDSYDGSLAPELVASQQIFAQENSVTS
jgi:hypothetical protein